MPFPRRLKVGKRLRFVSLVIVVAAVAAWHES
jgi:hypothetical protein